MKDEFADRKDFAWQGGNGLFSVSASQVGDLVTYIERQAEHHRKITFKEEFRKLLERYEVEYDERYVWDQSGSSRDFQTAFDSANTHTPGVAGVAQA